MNRLWLACSLLAILIAATPWIGAQTPAPPLFTGVTTPMEGNDLSVARRRFEPGARTYWHSHERGQLLLNEAGRMRIQKRGSSMRELGPGESDYTGPNIVHWHGAGPGGPHTQINVGFGGAANWLEAVSDKEYSGQ